MRKLALFCAAFAGAIFAAQYLLPESLLLFAAGGCAVLGALWTLSLKGETRRRVGICALGLTLALCYDWVYRTQLIAPTAAMADATEHLTAELCDYAEETEFGARAEVRILDRGAFGRALLYGDESLLALAPGDRIAGRMSLSSAARVRDTELTTFTSRGIFLLLYAKGTLERVGENESALRYLPQRLSHRAREVIAAVFPDSSQPFLRAILLGDRSQLSEAESTYLQEAGLFHVTAVSGLHCAFLLSLLGLLIGRERRGLLALAAIPTLALYTLAVGATPSVVRACVMLAMALLAPLCGRESDAPTSLFFALLLILIANPCAAASVSLQLSFAAAGGILYLTPKLAPRIRTKRRALRFLLSSLAATAGALVFTVPLTAYYFGLLPLAAPVSNLLCLWAASFTFMAGLIVLAIGFFLPAAARILAYAPHCGAQYILWCARQITRLPYHAAYFENGFLKVWLVYVYAMLVTCRLAKKGRLRYALAGVLAVLTLCLTLFLNERIVAGGTLRVSALNVGQGQCVVLLSGGHSAIVDCGSSNSYIAAGEIAADYLQSAGCRKVDRIILSHYHADHLNGLPVLLARMKAGQLILPDIERDDPLRAQTIALAEKYGVEVAFVDRTVRFALGEASVTVYPPVTEGEMNEECLSVLCSTGTFDALFTGDMDANTEYRLLTRHDLPDIEVLMAGHHGSSYSTGEDLLAQTKPEVGVVSCGDNSYGHPSEDVLERLRSAGAKVYRTDRQGSIHITVN